MRYTRVYADSHGESHFEDVDVEMTPVDFAPPAPPMNLSDFASASKIGFLNAPSGLSSDWHLAPCRQFMIYLAGQIEAQTSDGESRTFGPGAVTLVEDTTGKGHMSRVVGTEDALLVVVQLDDSTEAN